MNTGRNTVLILVFLLGTISLSAQDRIKVACIGNSVTFGAGLQDRSTQAYPRVLQKLLGENYEVQNFGYSGATLLNNGHRPYTKLDIYNNAIDFQADIVVIHLGLNDTDPRDWPNYGREFVTDYLNLIESFRNSNSSAEPEIWICRMTPIFPWHRRFVWSTRDWFLDIQKAIEEVAQISGAKLIDLHSPLYSRPDLFKDSLHPSAEGASIMATTIHQHLRGNFGGLSLAEVFTDNMLVQRDKPIQVWGTADSGEKIEVRFGKMRKTVVSGEDGKWTCNFDPIPAGGPYLLTVSSGKEKIVLNNILSGDIWICSGQSNMAFGLKSELHFKDLGSSLNNDKIRLLHWTTDIWPSAGAFSEDQLERLNRGDYYHSASWNECSDSTAAEFSAVAYYFGRMLQDSTNVPIGLIHNSIGGSTTESWINRSTLEKHNTLVHLFDGFEKNEMIMPWARERAMDNLKATDNPYQQHPFKPGYLFDQGIKPLKGLAFKGVIWYQGESNAENVLLHEEEFKTLITDWRSNLGNDTFPFYYVQLSSINRPTWGEFRNSQRLLLEQIENTGMAVSSDIGHPTNVHPKNKKLVGERLALWALAKDYGKNVVYSGPLYQNSIVEGNKIRITFRFADGGLFTSDGSEIKELEIAAADGKFVKAKGRIEGSEILVWSESISRPSFVRYSWFPYSEANLVNASGLPASTFITEN